MGDMTKPLNADDELDKYLFETWNMKDTVHNRVLVDGIKRWHKKHELEARLSSERDTLNTLTKAWNGTYDDANDILQLLIDNSRLGIKNLEQELEKLWLKK